MSDVIYTDGHREVRRAPALARTKGGAHAFYEVQPIDPEHRVDRAVPACVFLPFQHDTISAVGVTGLTNEAVLAVVIDRLRGFQAGAFWCEENEDALLACEVALKVLEKRTANRRARGVEGTHEA